MDGAAQNGHLSVVQYLHHNRAEGCTTAAMDQAAAHGYLDVVKWLHQYRTEDCTRAAMDGAALPGHLEVVQWLHENRAEGYAPQHKAICMLSNGYMSIEPKVVQNESWAKLLRLATPKLCNGFLLTATKDCHADCMEEAALLTEENDYPEMRTWILEHYPALRDIVMEY
ncbi:hypothetical protein L916_16405 [Phytophthora nicotianae]|uniref:Uncharacterized protein n=1 Tax=Phytophthora nicotianae TaxID=4792 RepID=W2I931_PHYNI|nr:hypothetical protein L916_16405 [Phytophthora nicotianae]